MPDTRPALLSVLADPTPWDVLVIGGGATGFGCAVEAASRGYRTLLLEQSDFAKGTSSRSTKLVHGGVRYLEQLNLTLVLDALRERGHMLRNAPHLVHDRSFVVPAYSWLTLPYYGFGLTLYERLSGKLSFGASKLLSASRTAQLLPGVVTQGLRGGVLYHDGQFDDARYIVSLLRTLQSLGGTAVNYVRVTGFAQQSSPLPTITAQNTEDNTEFTISARVVINATGAFSEDLLRQDAARQNTQTKHLLALSQGSHFVLPGSFLAGNTALMVPKTSDGRVLFAIPWHGHTVIGTTDEPVPAASAEPRALPAERHFLLDHIRKYFGRQPKPNEILSVWSGLRPLVKSGSGATSRLSRDHTILVSPTGLVTVTGGKWTTYRRMGQDAIDRAATVANLPAAPSRTLDLRLHGWAQLPPETPSHERVYGSDLPLLQAITASDVDPNQLLHPALPYRVREVLWALRHELARTTEDVLARRTRALFLNARAAIQAAPLVAQLVAAELGRDDAARQRDLDYFLALAQQYVFMEE